MGADDYVNLFFFKLEKRDFVGQVARSAGEEKQKLFRSGL